MAVVNYTFWLNVLKMYHHLTAKRTASIKTTWNMCAVTLPIRHKEPQYDRLYRQQSLWSPGGGHNQTNTIITQVILFIAVIRWSDEKYTGKGERFCRVLLVGLATRFYDDTTKTAVAFFATVEIQNTFLILAYSFGL